MSDLFGELTRGPDYIVGRLTRRFDHASGLVWRMMTESESLPLWLAVGASNGSWAARCGWSSRAAGR